MVSRTTAPCGWGWNSPFDTGPNLIGSPPASERSVCPRSPMGVVKHPLPRRAGRANTDVRELRLGSSPGSRYGAKNPVPRSRSTASMGSPVATSPPSHGRGDGEQQRQAQPDHAGQPGDQQRRPHAGAEGERTCVGDQRHAAGDERDHVEPGQVAVGGGQPGPAAGGEGVERGEQLGAGRRAQLGGAPPGPARPARGRRGPPWWPSRAGLVDRPFPLVLPRRPQVGGQRLLDGSRVDLGAGRRPGQARRRRPPRG